MTETTATAMPARLGDDDAFDPIEARLRQNTRATIEALFEEELEAAIGRCRHTQAAVDNLFGIGARLQPATYRDFVDQRV